MTIETELNEKKNQKGTKMLGEKDEKTDLMSIKELCLKHGYKYDYLYKCAVIDGKIHVSSRGTWKLSESEVLEFSRRMAEKKLDKIRRQKGEEETDGWNK